MLHGFPRIFRVRAMPAPTLKRSSDATAEDRVRSPRATVLPVAKVRGHPVPRIGPGLWKRPAISQTRVGSSATVAQQPYPPGVEFPGARNIHRPECKPFLKRCAYPKRIAQLGESFNDSFAAVFRAFGLGDCVYFPVHERLYHTQYDIRTRLQDRMLVEAYLPERESASLARESRNLGIKRWGNAKVYAGAKLIHQGRHGREQSSLFGTQQHRQNADWLESQ
jgi:hypothetical protein